MCQNDEERAMKDAQVRAKPFTIVGCYFVTLGLLTLHVLMADPSRKVTTAATDLVASSAGYAVALLVAKRWRSSWSFLVLFTLIVPLICVGAAFVLGVEMGGPVVLYLYTLVSMIARRRPTFSMLRDEQSDRGTR